MFDRSEIVEELVLRESVQKMIRLAKLKSFRKVKNLWLEEKQFRELVSGLIVEVAAEDPADNPYDSTGINALADMFKNTNYLQTIRTKYKQLTSSPDQRLAFRKMFLNLINRLMIQVANREDAGEEIASSKDLQYNPLNEDVELDIEDESLNDMSKFIDVPELTGSDDIDVIKEPEEISDDPRNINMPDLDKKGSKNALEAFEDLEGTIITHFAGMSKKDREDFRDYNLTNSKLYIDQFESELGDPAIMIEPESPDYDPDATQSSDLPGTVEPEDDISDVAPEEDIFDLAAE